MSAISDSSLDYEPTYSGDERIKNELEKQRRTTELLESNREKHFEEVFRNRQLPLFNFPGLTFIEYTHKKIKFSFTPREIVTHVISSLKIYVTLRYLRRYQKWIVKRNSIPLTYKNRVYTLFYDENFFTIGDEDVNKCIARIYKFLVIWSEEHDEFRVEKFERTTASGEDLNIDEDDMEIFLTEEEREELIAKRNKIWKRMLPPPARQTRPRYRLRR